MLALAGSRVGERSMSVLTVSLVEKLTGQDASQIQRLDASNRQLQEVKNLR